MTTSGASAGDVSKRWLPADFEHPTRVDLKSGAHMRPIRGGDVDIDYPAVMSSRESLWQKYGEAWQWPPATMTFEQDREDLERHEREIAAHESFNYAILDDREPELLGCVYLDPPSDDNHDALVSWWVVDDLVGSALEAELGRFVPRWVTTVWPFRAPRFGP